MGLFEVDCGLMFHPVGQGLFATGVLDTDQEHSQGFRWVYDCGTSSKQVLLQNAIQRTPCGQPIAGSSKPSLDLVTVSHFDNDHISGLETLLSEFSIGTLLLPYMPLWQRLVLAFSEGVDTQQALMRFFLNPVAYLADIPGADIGQIVFVPPSPEAGPPENTDLAPVLPQTDGPWGLKFDRQDERSDDENSDMAAFESVSSTSRVSVEMMRAGSGLQVERLWEFIPYNDSSVSPKPTPKFCEAVEVLRQELLNAATLKEAGDALVALKNEYDKHFGKSAKQRNVISLFLYGGPIGGEAVARFRYVNVDDRERFGRRWYFGGSHKGIRSLSILYTGDGYLETKSRLSRLRGYLGNARTERIGCLQVMHHGAKGNWHCGVAKAFSPVLSVFSSDPAHKGLGHPHAPVLRDFWPYNPVQADSSNPVSIFIRVAYP